jgi:hypothetical protein
MNASRQLRGVVLTALLALAGASQAQLLAGISVQPGQVAEGGSVKATVNFDVMSGARCGLRIQWGDGASTDYKINQPSDLPLVASHTYARAGSYKVVAEPKSQGMTMPKCGGRNQDTVVTVAAAAATAKKVAATSASPCPAGWKLDKTGVNRKTRAFTCIAPASTALPVTKVGCPGDLGYFENARKGQLGCRP